MNSKFLQRVFAALCVLWSLMGAGMSQAAMTDTPLRFGALAYRPRDMTQTQWAPLSRYLERALDRPVAVTVYDFQGLERAIAQNQVDIVLTNPGHYILLQHRIGLSSPLVTQTMREGLHEFNAFGGVIFTRTGMQGINRLEDVAGMKVAATSNDSFGGFQMQAFEMLEAGLKLPKPESVVVTGMPHDSVVLAVLSGKADVGFVRSGVLEAMVREGRLEWGQVKILHQQLLPAFPFATSTRLYPEWPVAVMPSVDERTAKQLTLAMLSIDPRSEIARSAGIFGFTTPANYGGVDEVLRRLRKPPYDAVPEVPVADLWTAYRQWIVALGFLLLVLVAVGGRLVLQSRNLKLSRKLLLESQRRYQGLVDWSPIGILVHREGQVIFVNPAAVRKLRAQTSAQLIGFETSRFGLPDQAHLPLGVSANSLSTSSSPDVAADVVHAKLHCLDGAYIEVDLQSTPIEFAGKPAMQVSFQDVTDRRRVEARLKLFANVFTHAREGIVITDARGTLVEVNDTFTAITGYSREEALGKNPRKLLWSGRQSLEFYAARNKVLAQTGHWSGEVWNRRKNGEIYAEMLTISAVRDDDGVAQSFVALFVDITPAKEHQKQLEHIAHYDALTSMPNRVLLADRLHQGMLQCQRRHTSLAVAFLDLDGFKAVNDRHGHDVGDELLVALAHRMKGALREGDTLARIGGDEFVAVMGDLESMQDCEPVLVRLLQAAAEPVRIGKDSLQVSASVGVTLYPQDAVDADQLLRHADQAMYLAKQAGKNRFHLFDIAKDAAVQTQREGLEHLRNAMVMGEFVLHYQPKVNMRTGVVVGLEALIRWQHPARGILPPREFLGLLEDHPLSIELGEWVIKSALMQITSWRAEGLDMPVSVNVGALQLQQSNFSDRLSAMLAQYPQVRRGALELEVLETTGLNDITLVAGVMHRCEKMGVTFALDDFGTGYSSLTYLKALPAQTLKIDQSFVRDMLADPDDLAIVNGVIGLARAFRRDVIAEGVETLEHGKLLLTLGCDLAQGYGIARPMPASEVAAWVAEWQASHAPGIAALPA